MENSRIRTLGPALIVAAVALMGALANLAHAQVSGTHNGHSYVLVGATDAQDARTQAAGVGGYVVAINDQAENTFVHQTFNAPYQPTTSGWGPFIGLSDEITEGSHLWDSGDPVSYTNWGPGEPNNNGVINGVGGQDEDFANMSPLGQWNDCYATLSTFAVLEVPNPTAPQIISSASAFGRTYHEIAVSSIAEARLHAASLSGNLVTVGSQAHETFIIQTFGLGSDIYIGLSDEIADGTFIWDSRQPVTYTNFDPNAMMGVGDYAVITANGLWEERAGHGVGVMRAIVEIPMALDLGVTAIVSPVSANPCGGELGSTTTVSVTITNFGAEVPQGVGIGVEFSVDGAQTTQETVFLTAPLTNAQSLMYTFANTADMTQANPATITARTVNPDADPGNDATSAILTTSVPAATLPIMENFDSGVLASCWVNVQGENPGGPNSDWLFQSGPTSSFNTGPNGDHTSGSGLYLYVEDSTTGEFDAVTLRLPTIDLRTATGPVMTFYMHSHDAGGPGAPTNNHLSIDVTDVTTGIKTMNVLGPIGHLGPDWALQIVDLSSFVGTLVAIEIRSSSNNNGFSHDIAIDDVRVLEYTGGNGQAPQPGIATLDINGAATDIGYVVSSGANGPYRATASAGGMLNFLIGGEVGQPVILFSGALNPGIGNFPGLGQLDIGGPNATGLVIVADGTGTGFIDQLFSVGPNSVMSVSLPLPISSSGLVFGFQSIVFNSQTIFGLSNAVEVTVN